MGLDSTQVMKKKDTSKVLRCTLINSSRIPVYFCQTQNGQMYSILTSSRETPGCLSCILPHAEDFIISSLAFPLIKMSSLKAWPEMRKCIRKLVFNLSMDLCYPLNFQVPHQGLCISYLITCWIMWGLRIITAYHSCCEFEH